MSDGPLSNSRLFPVAQEQLTTDDYYTPPWVFEQMKLTFDLDVAAPPGGVEWVPADRFYSQADDGVHATVARAGVDEPTVQQISTVGSPLHGASPWRRPPAARPDELVERVVESDPASPSRTWRGCSSLLAGGRS